MQRKEIRKLVAGFRRFREQYYTGENSLYDRLSSSGQSPKTLIIGCSDSRVDPAIISSASPGDLFVVRNVANLVPPYEEGGMYHGVSAAIEFAVTNLKVEHAIVLGHRQCGGIRALMTENSPRLNSFVDRWVQISRPAKERVLEKYPNEDLEAHCRHCEMESIVTSLENMSSFPFVQEAIRERGLELHGIYFDLERGELLQYGDDTKSFHVIEFDYD